MRGGQALRESRVARTGLPDHEVLPCAPRPPARSRAKLRRLGVDQIDLYIVHWPQGGPTWAWPGWKKPAPGHRSSIGVSSCGVSELEQVTANRDQSAAVNQVMFSPFEYRKALLPASFDSASRSRIQPPRNRPAPLGSTVVEIAEDRRAYAGAGPAALVHPAPRRS